MTSMMREISSNLGVTLTVHIDTRSSNATWKGR
jgi:hypothetical protein